MKILLKVTSFLGLSLTVMPAFFVLGGSMTWNTHAVLMIAGTVFWFATAPFWMRSSEEGE